MCTGFIKKGKDLLCGFNLDIDPEVWNFSLYKTKDYFTVGIKAENYLCFTHGVNKEGNFGNLPYMNDYEHGLYKRSKTCQRIDLLMDSYIKSNYSYNDILDIVKNKTIVNPPKQSMHSLISDALGNILLIEPEYGYKEIKDNFSVVTNYPLLTNVEKIEPWYGKDRYDIAYETLEKSDDSFNALDGIKLLERVKQEGKWATRISFVYSKNEQCVYYVLDSDFSNVMKHYLG